MKVGVSDLGINWPVKGTNGAIFLPGKVKHSACSEYFYIEYIPFTQTQSQSMPHIARTV